MVRANAFIALTLTLLADALCAQSTPALDPPPVDEAALVHRLVSMAKPERGERAVILYDPTYYPGITTRLRDELDARGVNSFAIVEETPAMIAAYYGDVEPQMRREQDVVSTLLPLFKAADIFYWMPLREYAGDMRWERLVAESRVRSVHFHWLLGFPGTRTAEEIVTSSRETERRALDVDLVEHARRQERLAAVLRGREVRITTAAGTDLVVSVAHDEWFHLGDGDASRARAARARSVRDRQLELPVGMFVFCPDAEGVSGMILAPSIMQSGPVVDHVELRIERGHIVEMFGAGTAWIRDRVALIGPDGDKIAAISLDTNPVSPRPGVIIALASNWEEAEPRRRNRPSRIRRMSIPLRDATLTVDGKTIIENGCILWDAF